jgi:hypothetical protein
VWAPLDPVSYTNEAQDTWWYRFIDLSPDTTSGNNVVSPRTVNTTATCEELEILVGGYAGFNREPGDPDQFLLVWKDSSGVNQSSVINNVATGVTTWMTNETSISNSTFFPSPCGERCVQILALQSASNQTADESPEELAQEYVPKPRLWACNNTLSQVTHDPSEGFTNVSKVEIPNTQAQILAGAIGLTGITTKDDPLQYARIAGDNGFNPSGDYNATDIAKLIMIYTANTISAMDGRGAPRQNITGDASPGPAQIVNVKWPYAGAILAGVPVIQFLMLLGVVAFSSKAIILDPSYLTAAHLLHPIMNKLGDRGMLLDVDEMAEEFGPDYKIAYAVRPNPEDPGHHDQDFVRDLGLVREDEGFGYIRGNQPTGRYD